MSLRSLSRSRHDEKADCMPHGSSQLFPTKICRTHQGTAQRLLEKAQNGQNATVNFFATLQSIITLLLLGVWYLSGQ